MKEIKELGFKGIKIHPDYQNTYIDDDKYYEILKASKDNGLIVLTHAGQDSGYVGKPIKCTPQRVLKVLDRLGGYDRLVLAHMGGKDVPVEVLSLLASKDVYLDTAMMLQLLPQSLFEKIIFKHGTDKILFATDSPWVSQAESIEILKSFNLGKEVEDKILYKNALDLLAIKE